MPPLSISGIRSLISDLVPTGMRKWTYSQVQFWFCWSGSVPIVWTLSNFRKQTSILRLEIWTHNRFQYVLFFLLMCRRYNLVLWKSTFYQRDLEANICWKSFFGLWYCLEKVLAHFALQHCKFSLWNLKLFLRPFKIPPQNLDGVEV